MFKKKWISFLLASLMIVQMIAQTSISFADEPDVLPNVYESFDYTAGTIEGRKGGEGFSDTGWEITYKDPANPNGTAVTTPDGLTYEGLTVSGGALVIKIEDDPALSEDIYVSREFEKNMFPEGQSTWIGFLMKADNLGNGDMFAMFNGNAEACIGKGWGPEFGIYTTDSRTRSVEQGQTHFVVAEVVNQPGKDDVYLWIDPAIDSKPSRDDAVVDAKVAGLTDFNTGKNKVTFKVAKHGAIAVTFDEFRMDSSWEAITGQPEKVVSTNVAFNKSITLDPECEPDLYVYATDGDTSSNHYVNANGMTSLTMDLEAEYIIDKVKMWHYTVGGRIYNDVIIQFSNDPDFEEGVITVFNNDSNNTCGQGSGTDGTYVESPDGKEFTFAPVTARYFRTWVNGSSAGPNGHWQEIEIYGALANEEVNAEVTAENGEIRVIFEDVITPAPVADDFEIRLSVDGTAKTVVNIYEFNYNQSSKTALINYDLIETAPENKIAVLEVNYKGQKLGEITFVVPGENYNVALLKPVTLIPPPPVHDLYRINHATDGITNGDNYTNTVETGVPTALTLDLGEKFTIDRVVMWHYAVGNNRTYKDVIIQFSNDPAFAAGVTTVFNNDNDNTCGQGVGTDDPYVENEAGTVFTFEPVTARYFRTWVNGHTRGGRDYNSGHWSEIKIYAAEAQEAIIPEVYESFDYTAEDSIAAKDGGEGLLDGWEIAYKDPAKPNGTAKITSEGLTYEGLTVNGRALNIKITDDSALTEEILVSRKFQKNMFLQGESTWVGFLMKANNLGQGDMFVMLNGNPYACIGKGWGPEFKVYTTGTGRNVVQGKTHFIVAEVVNKAGNDDVYLWVDPPTDSKPSRDDALFVNSHDFHRAADADKITFKVARYGANDVTFDEIRIDSSWEAITNREYVEKAPSTPTGITASNRKYADKIVVSWNNSLNDPEEYEVYRGTSNEFEEAELIATVATTNYEDTSDLLEGTGYYYFIIAKNSSGSSQESSPAIGRLGVSDTAVGDLARPVVTIAADGKSLTWEPIAGATGYQVYRNSIRSIVSSERIADIASTAYMDEAGDGKSFYYVRAYNATERSNFSTAVTKPSSITKIIPIGDSITYIPGSYRGALYTKLINAGYNIDFVGRINSPSVGGTDPDCQGMDGAVIGPGVSWIDPERPDQPNNVYDNVDSFMELDPDIALLLIGVNEFTNYMGEDAAKRTDGKSHERLEAVIRKMLANKPEMKILVSSLIPVADNRTAQYPMGAYNAAIPGVVNKLVSEGYDIYFVDMNTEAEINPNDTGELYDGLHPTPSASAKMADVWFQHLIQILPEPASRDVYLAPYPKTLTMGEGNLILKGTGRIFASVEGLRAQAEVLADEIYITTGVKLEVHIGAGAGADDILLTLNPAFDNEEYTLSIGEGITVTGKDKYAVSLGTSTLMQLLNGSLICPKLEIQDKPDSEYRAVSLDVARRFTSIDSIKKIVNLCRISKINYLQLHLTDDQNWMFPSEAYPNLGKALYNTSGKPAYTKAELEDLEKYASDRGVIIIPELDMPGHTGKLIQAYPEVFGIHGPSGLLGCINFASDTSREAVKTLIDEALDIFESTPYYHMGGDEASYGGASNDPAFQAAYTRLGVPQNDASNEEVFRDFIVYVNNHVKSKGKKLIVWEGFPRLSNPKVAIPKDIMIINWEHSYYDVRDMLNDGYTVVNGSWHPYYVADHYPGNNYTYASPEEIYRYTRFMFGHNAPGYPGYNPIITVPSDSDVPGSMLAWWEGVEKNLIPLMRYRVSPFGAKLWNPEYETNYNDFAVAASRTDALFDKVTNPVTFDVDLIRPERGQFDTSTTLTMTSDIPGEIRYTLNGNDPTIASTLYNGAITINNTMAVKAALFVDGVQVGLFTRGDFEKVVQDSDPLNLAFGKPVTVEGDFFPNNPPAMITDGVIDAMSYWYGARNPQTVTIDLGEVMTVGKAIIYSAWNQGIADRFNLEVSTDGENFTKVANWATNSTAATSSGYTVEFEMQDARYVRINTFKNSGGWADGDKARIVEVKLYEESDGGPIPEDENIALFKPVTLSPLCKEHDRGKIPEAVDGILSDTNYTNCTEDPVPSSLTIDLEAEYIIDRVVMWHYAVGENRVYEDVILQFSNDPEFIEGVITVFNNDHDNSCGQGTGEDELYTERLDGKEFRFEPVTARYFRTWVNGYRIGSGQIINRGHWQEIEIYEAKEDEEEINASISAINGTVTATFEKDLPELPTAEDFEIKLTVNGEESTAATSLVKYNNNTKIAEITINSIQARLVEQTVVVEVYYKGKLLGEASFVIPAMEQLTTDITVGSASGMKVGNIVEIPVTIANNPGITEFVFDISYDSTKLSLVTTALEEGNILPDGTLFDNISDPNRNPNKITANFMGIEDFTDKGTLFTLKFKVLSNAAGKTNNITLDSTSMTSTGVDGNTFRNVTANITNGSIEVQEESGGGTPSDPEEPEDPEDPEEPEKPEKPKEPKGPKGSEGSEGPKEPEEPEAPQIPAFDDLEPVRSWAEEAINEMAKRGILVGNGQGQFFPTRRIIRADFIRLIVVTLGLESDSTENFDDVPQGTYYTEAVAIAKSLGIVAGGGNNLFAPLAELSRQDMMVIVARALVKQGKLTIPTDLTAMSTFDDASDVADYAKPYVNALIEAGYIVGSNNKIHPTAIVTRAEAAVILYNLIK